MMREGIEIQTFQFEMGLHYHSGRLPEEVFEKIREHNVKIVGIDAYVTTDKYGDTDIKSVDLELEGDIADLNKLAVSFEATTDKFGYIIK